MKGNSLANFVYGEIRKKVLANQLTGGSRKIPRNPYKRRWQCAPDEHLYQQQYSPVPF